MSEYVFTLLGCGASPGVPRIGNDWGACDPQNPKNKRRRSALLIERRSGDVATRILVDTGPDLREQMIDAGIGWVDAVFYTHPHADHIHGIDDLRAFAINHRRRVDVYMDIETSERVRGGFDYCFRMPKASNYPPILEEHRIRAFEPVTIDGPGGAIEMQPFLQIHGSIPSLGFRVGDFAYSTDASDFPDETLPYLRDLDTWIVGALRHKPHPSHFSVAEAVDWAGRLGPRRTILTHMHVDLDYETLGAELPDGIEPGFDGLTIVRPAAD